MSVKILQGDCAFTLDLLHDKSVHCCVTSPPYWGLRDYGVAGQLGLESTPTEYVEKMVAVFREVRRVLRDDGTLWLNLGDSYTPVNRGENARPRVETMTGIQVGNPHADIRTRKESIQGVAAMGLKTKDLVGIPWRVAFALQADGWYLRQDIIWHKPNPMPESVRDRCTKAHEYIFLLAKSEKYYFDSKAIHEDGPTYVRKASGYKGFDATHTGANQKGGLADKDTVTVGRNKRSVWTVTTKPFKGAHFATFPPALIEPCILAGCPEGGTVLDPFGGAGTTGLVAQRHKRNAILCELNPEYVEVARTRITKG